jgi:hypothetical protein
MDENYSKSKRKAADAVVVGTTRGSKIKVNVDYEDRKVVKRRDSEWDPNTKSWYIEITELPEVEISNKWYMAKRARQLYEELKIDVDVPTKYGAQILGEKNGRWLLNVSYKRKDKIKKIQESSWDGDHWTLPSDTDVPEKLAGLGFQPLLTTTQIVGVEKRQITISHRGEIKDVPYYIDTEETTGPFGKKGIFENKILCMSDGEYDEGELDKEKLKEEKGVDELKLVTDSRMTAHTI